MHQSAHAHRAMPTQQNPMHQFAAPPSPPRRRSPASPPTKTASLRTTTLAETRTTDLGAELAQRFGHPRPAPGWRIPQAMPTTAPVAKAVRRFIAKTQCPET